MTKPKRAYTKAQEAKRQSKAFEVDPNERVNELIEEHDKRLKKQKTKVVRIPNDPFKTQFIVPFSKDSDKVISNYKEHRKKL